MQNYSRLWQHMPLIIFFSRPSCWISSSYLNHYFSPKQSKFSNSEWISGKENNLDKLVGNKEIFTGSSTQQSCDGSSNAAYGMNIKQSIWKKTLDADIIFIADRICRVPLPSCYGEHITIGTCSLVSFYQDGALPNKSSDQDQKEVKIPWLTCRSHQNPEYNLSIPLPIPPPHPRGKTLLHAWHFCWL